jgi:hypothetical protein
MEKTDMRACFLGQNIFALGFGVATLQSPPLVHQVPGLGPADEHVSPGDEKPPAEPGVGIDDLLQIRHG